MSFSIPNPPTQDRIAGVAQNECVNRMEEAKGDALARWMDEVKAARAMLSSDVSELTTIHLLARQNEDAWTLCVAMHDESTVHFYWHVRLYAKHLGMQALADAADRELSQLPIREKDDPRALFP
jgi:hypothetical protein